MANPLLDFRDSVNTRTGEMGRYKTAKYKGFTFKIYYPTTNSYYRATLEGSMHKFWNNGEHNYNDFKLKDIKDVISDLELQFDIKPENCKLKQLELGVNLIVNRPAKLVLDSCILHHSKIFKNKDVGINGHFIQAEYQQYVVKVYDKGKQYRKKYNITDEIIRFEIKYKSMSSFREKGINTLQDLLNSGLINYLPILLKHWDNIIHFDSDAFKNHKCEFKYNNPIYWGNLSTSNFKYHRGRLNKWLSNYPNNIRNYISALINEKINDLCVN